MSGAWVTWCAEVLTFPGMGDITENMNRAVAQLAWSRDIDAATHDYLPGARNVRLRLRVRHGISEVPVKGYAHAALQTCLLARGLGLDTRDVGPLVVIGP